MAGPAKKRTPKQSRALAKALGIRSDMARALGLHQKPGPKIGSKLVPARIKHNGRTYAGKVKRVNGKVKIFVTPEVARKINPQALKLRIAFSGMGYVVEGGTKQKPVIFAGPYRTKYEAIKKRKEILKRG